ncbi:MAG: hypothetical protein IPN13_14190 [Bacteroidetes bacterium]|nr:hypothetical protein [Bacteroidota bacterium]
MNVAVSAGSYYIIAKKGIRLHVVLMPVSHILVGEREFLTWVSVRLHPHYSVTRCEINAGLKELLLAIDAGKTADNAVENVE